MDPIDLNKDPINHYNRVQYNCSQQPYKLGDILQLKNTKSKQNQV